jgi:hypothetical protein
MDVLQQTILCVKYYKEWIAESHVKIDGLQQNIPSLMVCCQSFQGWSFAAKHKKNGCFLLQILLNWKPYFVYNTMKNGLQKVMIRLMVCNKSYQV